MIKAAIMEINPFHNGHKYFLSQIPKAKDDILIVIFSTSIVQRGEITVLNKHDKAELLLDHGVDIAIALPSVLANQGADYFSNASLQILSNFNVQELYFGSESNDLKYLMDSDFVQTNNFKQGIYNSNSNIKSNDILGKSYLKAITNLNLNIKPILIKRIANNYNDQDISGTIASATSIRNNIDNTDIIKDSLPKQSLLNLQSVNHELLFKMFCNNLNFCLDTNYQIFLSENNQLLKRLNKVFMNNSQIVNIDQLASLSADKNNSQHKYKRIIINTILLISDQLDLTIDYIQLLGFSHAGKNYIKQLNNKQIVTTLKNESSDLAKVEIRASKLYNLVTNQNILHDYLPPIINCDTINE